MLKETTYRSYVARFCKLANSNLGYCADNRKVEMHRLGRAILRQLAETMNLSKEEYEIRSNKGGIAVNGEITLHSQTFYLQLGGTFPSERFLFRSCKGLKDYCGGDNHYAPNSTLRVTGHIVALVKLVS